MQKVLITDDCDVLLPQGLAAMGYHCDFEPDISPAETLERIPEYEGLIINSKILVNREFLDKAVQLKFIGRLGSGMEIVDRVYAAEKGVAVLSSPEGNCNAVAEQALGMLLCLANNILRSDREVRQNIWRREFNRGFELRGKTIGIIGFGHTGSRFAEVLAGLGMRILVHDKYKSGFAHHYIGVAEASAAQIQAEADVISLHLPLTPETKHYVDHAFIQACKPGFVLINTSRGHCVRTEDLVEALEAGKIGGACLDVFENEKTQTRTPAENGWYDRLQNMEQVVLTPHIAGWTHESKKLLATTLLQKIQAALSKP